MVLSQNTSTFDVTLFTRVLPAGPGATRNARLLISVARTQWAFFRSLGGRLLVEDERLDGTPVGINHGGIRRGNVGRCLHLRAETGKGRRQTDQQVVEDDGFDFG